MGRTAWIVALGSAVLMAGCSGAAPTDSSASSGSTASSSPSSASASPAGDPLRLVVIGDSIPFNSKDDCPGCTAFVYQYSDALARATGKKVEPDNLSDHTGLTLPRLLDELDSQSPTLAKADAIIVAIAHNSIELNQDAPCGSPVDPATGTLSDWSKIDQKCATASAAAYRARYDQLFSTIAGLRAGKPTILIALNKYNDWVGGEGTNLTPDQAQRTVTVHDAWNSMLCDSAKANSFTCADIYHAFNGPTGEKPSGDLLAGDYTHPSQKGNDEITRVLVERGFAPLM
ncbi:MAG: SGNH/GDSL hydrolase family protein [Knoellia sp.]